MQAIITKYYGPGNVRGSRVKAECEAGSVTLGWDHSMDPERNHHRAALALCKKLKWGGVLVCGGMPNAGYCYVFSTRRSDRVSVYDVLADASFVLATDGTQALSEIEGRI